MFKTTRKDIVFNNPHLTVTDCAYTTPSGRTVKQWLVAERKEAVVIAAQHNGKWLMIYEERALVHETMMGFPAGQIDDVDHEADDKNANAEDSAKRELIEETGYECKNMRNLGYFYTSCGFTNEKVHLFYASELTKVSEKLGVEGEGILGLKMLTTEEFKAAIAKNDIKDSNTNVMFAKLIANGII